MESVQGKGKKTSGQVRNEKTNESEPLMKYRKRRNVIETRLQSLAWDEVWGKPVYHSHGGRYKGGVSSFQASIGNSGTCRRDVKGEFRVEAPRRKRVPMRGTGADQPVVVTKSGNADRAKGLDDPAWNKGQPKIGRS